MIMDMSISEVKGCCGDRRIMPDKSLESAGIQSQVDEFLAGGGEIQTFDSTVISYDAAKNTPTWFHRAS